MTPIKSCSTSAESNGHCWNDRYNSGFEPHFQPCFESLEVARSLVDPIFNSFDVVIVQTFKGLLKLTEEKPLLCDIMSKVSANCN